MNVVLNFVTYWWLSKVEHTLSGRQGERCYWLFPGCTFRHWRGLPQHHQVSTEVPQPLHALSWGNWWTGWQLTPRSPLPHLQLAAGTAGLTTDSFVLELSGRVLMESCSAEFFLSKLPYNLDSYNLPSPHSHLGFNTTTPQSSGPKDTLSEKGWSLGET